MLKEGLQDGIVQMRLCKSHCGMIGGAISGYILLSKINGHSTCISCITIFHELRAWLSRRPV